MFAKTFSHAENTTTNLLSITLLIFERISRFCSKMCKIFLISRWPWKQVRNFTFQMVKNTLKVDFCEQWPSCFLWRSLPLIVEWNLQTTLLTCVSIKISHDSHINKDIVVAQVRWECEIVFFVLSMLCTNTVYKFYERSIGTWVRTTSPDLDYHAPSCRRQKILETYAM